MCIYIHLRCLRCGEEYAFSTQTMEELKYTQYSYCESCLHEAMKLLKSQDEAVKQYELNKESHPAKTRKEDFFERFPNAPKDGSGMPIPCVRLLGYIQKQCYADCYADRERECADCWNKEVEE